MDLRYVIIEPLGAGSFATVLKVKSSLTDTYYALKVARNQGREILRNEAELHSRLTHPNIIQFVSAFESLNCNQIEGVVPLSKGQKGNCTAMVVEFCQFGTLQTRMVRQLPTMGQLQIWAVEIASGLLYLKEQGIIHRDIKPDNILLCGNTAKIGDFGLAKYAEDISLVAKKIGTPFYMPYEAFSSVYSYATDVFALGVVIYNMYTGYKPFNARTEPELMKALKANVVEFVFNKRNVTERDESLEELLLRMLAFNSNLRPSIEEIVKHPFFHVEELDSTVIIDNENEFDDDNDDLPMSMVEFRNHKAEFGDGTREQFYIYLANLKPHETPLSMAFFTILWNNL